jgi:ribosomal protein S18 acetylase RimI-like enzyme
VQDRSVQLTFEQARPEDCDELHAILTAAGLDMQERWGLSHWVPAYPLARLRGAVDEGRVHSIRSGSQIVGTYTLAREAPDYVPSAVWARAGDPAIYVTRLAVHPTHQRTGIGHACMDHIEDVARREHLRSIRLDASADHGELLRFYRGQGYEERGRFEAFGTQLVCFEKVLTSDELIAP